MTKEGRAFLTKVLVVVTPLVTAIAGYYKAHSAGDAADAGYSTLARTVDRLQVTVESQQKQLDMLMRFLSSPSGSAQDVGAATSTKLHGLVPFLRSPQQPRPTLMPLSDLLKQAETENAQHPFERVALPKKLDDVAK